MLSKIKCVTFKGLTVVEVAVEVSVVRGLPAFEIVGLPNKSIEESKHRIKSAFLTGGYEFADSRITVNLAPADIIKMGSCYDLAIAVGVYCAKNKIGVDANLFFFGELSLDGYIRHTRGAYLALDYVCSIGGKLFISSEMVRDFKNFGSGEIYSVEHIGEVFGHISHKKLLKPYIRQNQSVIRESQTILHEPLITDVIGQQLGKRAVEIAAAGGHNLMLVGSPGTGKSMLAKSMVSILPSLEEQEAIQLKRIHSYAGETIEPLVSIKRPFRAPHHTISYSGMIGGGPEPMPGEVTLAHNGVLFMDEFCEFSRNVLEALRQPLQEGYVALTRHNMTYTFPSRFILLAASNPCPCGYLGHATKPCVCTEQKLSTYAKKLSGPVADRFDIFVQIYPEADFTANISDPSRAEECLTIKNRVAIARNSQSARLKKYGIFCNASMTNNEIMAEVTISRDSRKFLNSAYTKLNITPRGYFKLLKVARTIADLSQSSDVTTDHIAEAVQYRQRI